MSMNKQQIEELIDAKVAGQGSAIDVGGALPTIMKETLNLIPEGGEQVQADWTESDAESPAFIKNKPTIPAAQVQSDWDQNDPDAPDFIKNKPEIGGEPVFLTNDDLSSTPISGSTQATLSNEGYQKIIAAIAAGKPVYATIEDEDGHYLCFKSLVLGGVSDGDKFLCLSNDSGSQPSFVSLLS